MRLVTGVAGRAAGVLGGDDLGEPLGLGGVLFVAAAAEVGDVGKFGDDGAGVVGVGGKGTVAGFAGDVGVLAGGASLGFVIMAQDAGVLSGVGDGALADGVQGAGAVVAVLTEVFRDDGAADGQEEAESGEENEGRAE